MDKADQEMLKAIQARVKELEAETAKWEAMQNAVGREMGMHLPAVFSTYMSIEEIFEADARSVYVGNVDYGASAEELAQHFQGCGEINRVTILCDKFSGHPKGHAYVEFADRESVANSLALQRSFFRERQLKVSAKRTNRPGISTTNRFHTGLQDSPMFRECSSGYPDIDAVKLVRVHRQCFQ